MPKLATIMDEAEYDVLAYMTFPKEHRIKLHSTNPIERLNGEIKRRCDVEDIFPNDDAIIRLVGSILLDHQDGPGHDCIVDCRFWDGYFAFEDIEWLSQRYADLFDGETSPIKLAVLTFDALLAALKSPTKTLFPTHAIQAFESLAEAKAWICSEPIK